MPKRDLIINTNKTNWNQRVNIHVASDLYDVKSFLAGSSSLRHIELPILESRLKGKKVLHLQCHFGMDSFSLERLGAIVTGVDFSEKAIEKALEIKDKLNSNVNFVLSDVLKLKECLEEKFDFVFTSYGTLVWLPDIDMWGDVIDYFLNPGGEFLMVDFHPVMYMLDDNFEQLKYDYFRRKEPFHSTSKGTYTDSQAPIEIEEYFWSQGLSEVMEPFTSRTYELLSFREFNYSPYNCFPNMEELDPEKYVFAKHQQRIPYVYLIHFKKKSS